MVDILEIFSEQECRIYKSLPMAVAIYVLDEGEVKTLLISDVMYEMFADSKEEYRSFLDHGMYNNVHPEDREMVVLKGEEFVRGGMNHYEATYRTKLKDNKNYVWIHGEGDFLEVDSDYKVAMISYQNVDDQMNRIATQESWRANSKREFEEMQKMLHLIVQQQDEYIAKIEGRSQQVIVFASAGNALGMTQGYQAMTYDEYERICVENIDIIDTFGDPRMEDCRKALSIGKNKPYATTYIVRDEKGDIYYRTQMFKDDTDENVYVIVTNVTDLVKVEYERAEKLEHANFVQNEFLSRMSHDMRTPLGAIISVSEFGVEEAKDPRIRGYFRQIKASSTYLISIMNDILDVQRLKNKAIVLNHKVFELQRLNENIQQMVWPRASEKGLSVTFTNKMSSNNPYVKLDQRRLQQVVINIINNAIKYTPENGHINWSCQCVKVKGKKCIQYTISDDGLGIGADFQKHMFETFSREDTDFISSEEGSGLGLSIVKNIVEMCNGTIVCDSRLGEGTTFVVTIPVMPIGEEEIVAIQSETFHYNETRVKGKKALLVEDIAINRKIARRILEEKGLIVTTSINGIEAVEEVRHNPFDLIFMDIRMPVMDGIEATKEIRKFNTIVPIYALSANAFVEDRELSLRAGMNGHLAKPLEKDKLIEVLAKL